MSTQHTVLFVVIGTLNCFPAVQQINYRCCESIYLFTIIVHFESVLASHFQQSLETHSMLTLMTCTCTYNYHHMSFWQKALYSGPQHVCCDELKIKVKKKVY